MLEIDSELRAAMRLMMRECKRWRKETEVYILEEKEAVPFYPIDCGLFETSGLDAMGKKAVISTSKIIGRKRPTPRELKELIKRSGGGGQKQI